MKHHKEVTRRGFLRNTALGAGALAALSGRAEAQSEEWTDQERANVQVVNDFCAAFATLDLNRPMEFCSDEVVYRMTETAPPATGPAEIMERLSPFVNVASALEFEVLKTFAAGPIVLNHRIDTFTSTERPLVWEGVGVFFVVDGKIQEWFDYTIRVNQG